MENKKETYDRLLPEALEINQLMRDIPQHSRDGIVKIAKIIADTIHAQQSKNQ